MAWPLPSTAAYFHSAIRAAHQERAIFDWTLVEFIWHAFDAPHQDRPDLLNNRKLPCCSVAVGTQKEGKHVATLRAELEDALATAKAVEIRLLGPLDTDGPGADL